MSIARPCDFIEIDTGDIGVELVRVIGEQPNGWFPLWKLLGFFPRYATWEVAEGLDLVWKFGGGIRLCRDCRHVIKADQLKHDPECVSVTGVRRKTKKRKSA